MTGQSEGGSPPEASGVPEALLAAYRDGLADADGLLFLSDFDGTLSPIVEDPRAAEPLAGTPDAFERLRDADRTEPAVISGRALDDLRDRFGVEGIGYAGNHGLELHHGGETRVHPDAREARDAIEAVATEIADRTAAIEGCHVRDKRVTATVHYRRAPDERVEEVREIVEDVVADRGDLRITTGKAIFELRPAVDWDKGDAVTWLRERLVPDGEDWLATYLGDDRTDEDAFAALEGGIGVKVGSRKDGEAGRENTTADYRLDDPHEVRTLVEWLAERRAGSASE